MALLLILLVAGLPVAALMYLAFTRSDPHHEAALSLLREHLTEQEAQPVTSSRRRRAGAYPRSA
jgi:hypothetical protein